MDTIDLGFKKFEITRQAFIVFIALILSFFIQLIALIFFVEDASIVAYAIFIIYIAIMIPLMVYTNNCLVSGKCVVLSWVMAMFYVTVAVVNVIAIIMIVMSKDKKVREELMETGMRHRPKKSSR